MNRRAHRLKSPGEPPCSTLEAYGRLPLDFEANTGQTDAQVKFLARTRGGLLFLTAGGASWHSRHADSWLHMKLAGSRPDARIRGLEELPGRSNYFQGSDPKLWRTNVPHYAKVEYQGGYPGGSWLKHWLKDLLHTRRIETWRNRRRFVIGRCRSTGGYPFEALGPLEMSEDAK